MRHLVRIALLLILLQPLLACGASDGRAAARGIVQSAKQRLASPDVATGDLAEMVSGNSTFAFDLYQIIKEDQANLFFSPFSISMALAMTYAGARGDTQRQMSTTLHFTLPQDRLHPAFNHLDLELANRGTGAEGKDDKGFRLNVVNAIWGQAGHTFLSEFLDVLAENYGAGLRVLDFAEAPEESRVIINDWVSEQTEHRIESLIPPGLIHPLTVLVLTNAVYFNAAWADPFDPYATQDGPFHLLGGGQVIVPMMRQTARFGYAEGEDCQAVELLYDGRELSMVILLPDEGHFEAVEASLDATLMDGLLSDLTYAELTLTMPKFEFESGFRLGDALAAMGMADAFSTKADFSGMDGTRGLFMQEVVHKTFVSVDEAGTEAAAATAVLVPASVPMEPPEEVVIDRPFIFAIRDIETGTILFVGRVVDPSG